MTTHRDAVRSNAKYLRNVRPIDPEEICTYIEGAPHPGVVRQLLREEAADLAIIEREDGTFVPVGDEPVSPNTGPVRRFPDRYARRLEDLLADRYGPTWYDGVSGDLLRSTIRRFKAQYLEGAPVEYDEDVAAGYAVYHLPGYYAAIQYALDDLADRHLLDRQLRVLDVGAGVGGPALGLIDYLPADALLEYHAVEPGDGAAILEELLADTGANVHTTIHREPIETFDPGPDRFDLVCCCNVLSELEEPEAVLRSTLEWIDADGAVLAMAPADKNTSIQLRELERAVEGADVAVSRSAGNAEAEETETETKMGTVTVYSPTVRLWPDERPTDRGWTFDVRPDLEIPPFQRRLEESATDDDDHDSNHGPGEFVNVDVQFSYSILRLDGTRRIDLELDRRRWAKMAEMDRHVTNRVDLVAAKLSHSLSGESPSSEGGGRNLSREPGSDSSEANPLFKVSDGSEAVDHYAVCTRETALNRALLEAGYGDVLEFERVLVLWNDDEGAYNLVVDEETIVDRIS